MDDLEQGEDIGATGLIGRWDTWTMVSQGHDGSQEVTGVDGPRLTHVVEVAAHIGVAVSGA